MPYFRVKVFALFVPRCWDSLGGPLWAEPRSVDQSSQSVPLLRCTLGLTGGKLLASVKTLAITLARIRRRDVLCR